MRRFLKINNLFWTHERSLTALLIYLTLALFTWIPLSGFRWWGFLISDLLFNLILLSGVFSVLVRWKKQLFFITIAILASSFRLMTFFIENNWIAEVNLMITILFLVFLIRMVLRHIFKEGPVNFYRIQGSIVVFMVLGMIWASLYNLLDLIAPGSFSIRGVISEAAQPFAQYLYFSFVTMSTLGSGDMAPIHSLAKSLVIFQGMIGLLYPVIMIARLVSMEVEHSSRAQSER